MERAACMERLLDAFAGSYDIIRGETLCGRPIEARAEMRALNSKYVLSKKLVLWQANAFEQCLFVPADTLTADTVQDWWTFLTEEAESPLVHPGEKYPPEGHMYTWLTVIFVADRAEDAAKQTLKKLRFTKNYLLSLRGWATGRAMVIDLEKNEVIVNAAGKDMKKPIEKLLTKA